MLSALAMKEQDDYVSGPHHYWIHFGFGAIFGAGIGVCIGWWDFDWTGWRLAAGVAAASIVVAYCCGRWGDRAWEWLIERFWWFT